MFIDLITYTKLEKVTEQLCVVVEHTTNLHLLVSFRLNIYSNKSKFKIINLLQLRYSRVYCVYNKNDFKHVYFHIRPKLQNLQNVHSKCMCVNVPLKNRC